MHVCATIVPQGNNQNNNLFMYCTIEVYITALNKCIDQCMYDMKFFMQNLKELDPVFAVMKIMDMDMHS